MDRTKPKTKKKPKAAPLKVLFAASECMPFIKTGGLADVVGALPKELLRLGADVRVILPCYKAIPEVYKAQFQYECEYVVNLGWRRHGCGISSLVLEGVTFYFIQNDYYFGRDYVYGDICCGDEGERFAFFTKAVLDALPHLGGGFYPDILHAHDWQAGMIPALLQLQYKQLPDYRPIHPLFTIHNLRYQGIFAWDFIDDLLSLGSEAFSPDKLEYNGCINFLKAGLVYSEQVTTVSPTYANEIQTPYFGEKLDGMLRARSNSLHGILNGIDNVLFDPRTDPGVAANYSPEDLSGKALCKPVLQREFGLEENPDVAVVGMVGRLVDQKGLDLVECVIGELVESGLQLAVLGSGDARYQQLFSWAAWRWPGRVGARFEYSERLSHCVYAGSDLFLMPSLFEPCGLSQLIALRYGTVPVVRETGGLKDSVTPYNKYTDQGLGFTFANYNAHEMLDAVRRGLNCYYTAPDVWARMMRRGMEADFSWDMSALRYMELYGSLRD